MALGSDGAGSVLIPAAMTGLVGLKPGFGRIPESIAPPRYRTFLGYGPMTRTVADAALMLEVLAGPDPSDPLSCRSMVLGLRRQRVKKPQFADRLVTQPGLEDSVDSEIVAICEEAVRAFERLGCTVEEAIRLGQPRGGDVGNSRLGVRDGARVA